MSILDSKFIEVRTFRPYKFQCDVCKTVFELTDDYEVEFDSDVEDQMAVVRYSAPAGFGDHDFVVHCCSPSCLFEAIKKIPFDGSVSIPCGGFYHKKLVPN